MYKKIEEVYKKQSPNTRIRKKIFWYYICIVIILFSLNVTNFYFLMTIITIISLFRIKSICEKELDEKLVFNFCKTEKDAEKLDEIIYEKEKNILKNYLKENNFYNKNVLKLIIEHYQNDTNRKIITNDFWSIATIIVSIILAFVTEDGFDIVTFLKAVPYLCSLLIIFITIYFFVKQFSDLKMFLHNEADMLEKLESIFSELYAEIIGEEKINQNEYSKKLSKEKEMLIYI